MKIPFRRYLHHTLVALFCLLSARFGSSFPVSLVTSTSTILLLPCSNINEKNNNNNHQKNQKKNLIRNHHHHHYLKNKFPCKTFLNSENVRGGGSNIKEDADAFLSEKKKNGILANDAYNLILNKSSLLLIGLMSSLSLIMYRFNVFRICSISDKTNFFLLLLSPISPSCHFCTTPSNTISTIAVPLLSSSCCIIQLLLNILIPSFGCAGFGKLFNKKSLKWIRPFFISILIHFTVISSVKLMMLSSSSIIRQRGSTVPILTILKFVLKLSTMWVLSLLPEIVHFWNRNEIMHQNQSIHRQGSRSTTTSTTTTTKTTKTTDDNGKICNLTFDIHIPSMGCVGCVNKILSSLKTFNNNIEKVNVDAWLHGEKKDVEESESSTSSSSSGGGAARVEISLPVGVGSGGGGVDADDGILSESEEDIYEIKERIEKELVERITNSGFDRSVIKSSKFVIN